MLLVRLNEKLVAADTSAYGARCQANIWTRTGQKWHFLPDSNRCYHRETVAKRYGNYHDGPADTALIVSGEGDGTLREIRIPDHLVRSQTEIFY